MSTISKFIHGTNSETKPQTRENWQCGYLMKEALAQVGNFKIGGRIINKARFVDAMAIIAKTQEELHDMLNRFFDTGRKYCLAINITKIKSNEEF